MIDLTPMGSMRADPGWHRAWVQGGALLGALDRAAMAHGLGTTAGNVSQTGVEGLTHGGGMGSLARRLGLTTSERLDAVSTHARSGTTRRAGHACECCFAR